MKKALFTLFLLLPVLASAQNNIKKTAAVAYTQGVPTFTPAVSSSTELAVDTATSKLYWWSRNGSTWVAYPRGFDIISGSSAPAYTPRDNQAVFAINADNEMYYYTGSLWVQVGGGAGSGGIYGGSGSVADGTVASLVDDFEFSGPDISSFTVTTGTSTGGQYFQNSSGATVTCRDTTGDTGISVGKNGINISFNDGSTDRLTITGRDARYAASYSATYSARSLIDKGYADATYAVTGAVSGSANQVAVFSGSAAVGGSANYTFSSNAETINGSGAAANVENTASSGSTAGGLLTLASLDNAANVFGDRLGSYQFKGQTNGSGGTGIGGSIQGFAFGTWSGSSYPTAMSFYTTDAASTTQTERLRIYSTSVRLRSGAYLGFDNTANTILIYQFQTSLDSALQLGTSIGGEIQIGGKFGVEGMEAVWAANKNDVFLGPKTFFSVTADNANRDVTGLVRSSVIENNRIVIFYNNGGGGADLNNLVFKHESGSSTAANRFSLPDGVDYTLTPYESVSFIYDNSLDRWVVISKSRAPVGGTATLSSGTVTVNTAAVKTGNFILVSYNTPSGTPGILSAPSASITNGTSFVINSTSMLDSGTVNWTIIK